MFPSLTLNKTSSVKHHIAQIIVATITVWSCSSTSALTLSSTDICSSPSSPSLSNPVTIGDGSPESCTETVFKNALSNGGEINFNCGSAPHTITMSSEAMVNLTTDTIIDGSGLITLSGGGNSRILNMDTGNFNNTSPTLTVMNLTFRDGSSSGTPITLGTYYDGGGGAIYYVGGNVRVFDSVFENNSCDDLGPDLAGGAIFGNGVGGTTIVNSHFNGNHCANGGAIGNLWTSTYLYNSIVENNQARGYGANYEGGEHGNGDGNQQGSGGNGGGIQMDGAENDLRLCGVILRNNSGNALGGGIFRTTYFGSGSMVIEQSTISNNSISNQPDFSAAGGLFFMGGPITISDTTFSDNQANIFGAIQLEDSHTTINFNNVEITSNTARTGLAAVWIGDGVSGSISNSNISDNSAPGSGGFAAAFAGNGIADVTLSNSTILNNSAGNGYNPISCWGQFIEGGGNYQWPVERSGEGSDDPDSLCSANITVGTPDGSSTTVSQSTPTVTPTPISTPEPPPIPTPEPTAEPTPTATPETATIENTDNNNVTTQSNYLQQFDNKQELVFNSFDSAIGHYLEYCLGADSSQTKLNTALSYYNQYQIFFTELAELAMLLTADSDKKSLPAKQTVSVQSDSTADILLQNQLTQKAYDTEYYLQSAVINYRNFLIGTPQNQQELSTSSQHYQLYQSSLTQLIGLCNHVKTL